MFNEFRGLPVHALAVHGAVVLVPLAALLGVLFATPRFRAWARVPLLLVSLGAVGAVFVAKQSGKHLETVLAAQSGDGWASNPVAGLVNEHQKRANLLFILVILFAVVAVAAYVLSRDAARFTQPVALALSAVLVIGAGALAFQTFRVGDIGSRALWNPTGSVDYN